MITLTSLSKIYRTDEIETVALENVNLTVDRGEFLSIMGPSGCGKSTLLNIMGLLDAPTTGTVEINGTHTEGKQALKTHIFVCTYDTLSGRKVYYVSGMLYV